MVVRVVLSPDHLGLGDPGVIRTGGKTKTTGSKTGKVGITPPGGSFFHLTLKTRGRRMAPRSTGTGVAPPGFGGDPPESARGTVRRGMGITWGGGDPG